MPGIARASSLPPSLTLPDSLQSPFISTNIIQRPNAFLNTLYDLNNETTTRAPLSPSKSANNSSSFLHSNSLSSSLQSDTLPAGTPEWLRALYNEKQITSRVDLFTKRVEIECPECGTYVPSNVKIFGKSVGEEPKFFASLSNHWRSKTCKSAKESRAADLSKENSTPSRPPHSSSSTSSSQSYNSRVSSSTAFSDDSFRADSTPSLDGCSGILIEWNVNGPFNDTFFWSRERESGPDSLPFRVKTSGTADGTRFAISKRCLGRDSMTDPCTACAELPIRIQELQEQAKSVNSHTRYSLLSTQQLREKCLDLQEDRDAWKLKFLTASRKVNALNTHLDDYKRFASAVAENNVPRLHALVGTALRHGAGIATITEKIKNAFAGTYAAKKFSETDLSLSLLCLRFGGVKLLYALNQALNLPSLRTVCNRMTFIRIHPTIGPIVEETIIANINDTMIKPRKSESIPRVRRGVSIMSDETKAETKLQYMAKENAVAGSCHGHTPRSLMTFNSWSTGMNIKRALDSGTLHYGKEILFVGASLFGEKRLYPLVVAPTCKHETATDWVVIFQTLIDTWKASGADNEVGPLWSFATDGDAVRRCAGYACLVVEPLSTFSLLYWDLIGCKGLNLLTGPNEITLDFDIKHIIKRFGTLFRSKKGTVINGRVLNRIVFASYFARLPGMTRNRITLILYPKDPQDVPRAIELLRTIIAVSKLDIASFEPCTPAVVADLDAIHLLGEMLESLLTVYTNVEFTLSQQVFHLWKASYMSFTLFRAHKDAVMSNQLYGDVQTHVKSVMFTVAKQRALDDKQPLYLFQKGTDRLEKTFGRSRGRGGHDSGMTYKQSLERFGGDLDVDQILEDHPQWDEGSRRLSMTRDEDFDHINFESWRGDVVVSRCDITAQSNDALAAAQLAFRKSQISPEHYDYHNLFKTGSGIDLLAPWGNKVYPGVSSEPDRSLIEDDDTASDLPVPATPLDISSPHGPASDSSNPTISNDPTSSSIPVLVDTMNALAVEDWQDSLETENVNADSHFITDDKNHKLHKAAFCRLYLSQTSEHLSHDRVLRWRGYDYTHHSLDTSVAASPEMQNPDEVIGAHLLIGETVATLVRVDKTLSLGVLTVTAISKGSELLADIALDALQDKELNIKITGQLLELCTIPSQSLYGPAAEEGAQSWVWTGAYSFVPSVVTGTTETVNKPTLITVSGHLIELLNPPCIPVTSQTDLSTIPEHQRRSLNSRSLLWVFSHEGLQFTCDTIWSRVSHLNIAPGTLPLVNSKVSGFPHTDNGGIAFICASGTALLAAKAATTNIERTCHFCGAKVKGAPQWRGHIGFHILRALLGAVESPPLLMQVGSLMPCGYCGLSGLPECALHMSLNKTSRKITSQCSSFITIGQYETASKGSNSNPCRNVPIFCQLCPGESKPVLWRYNFVQHLHQSHPSYAYPGNEGNGLLSLPYEVWKDIEIFDSEQAAAGIDSSKRLPSFMSFTAPESPEDSASTSNSRKRKSKNVAGNGTTGKKSKT